MDKTDLDLATCDRLTRLTQVISFVSESLLQVDQFSEAAKQGAAEVLDIVSDNLASLAGLERNPRSDLIEAA